MKNFIVITIYGISIFIIVLSVINIMKEDRVDNLEYIMVNEPLEVDLREFFIDGSNYKHHPNIAVIYFVESNICSPCMTEITEFNRLINNRNDFIKQLFIVNTESKMEAVNLMTAIDLDIEYKIGLSEAKLKILSAYDLRELVGQMIFIDIDENKIFARVILETIQPSKYDSKKKLLETII